MAGTNRRTMSVTVNGNSYTFVYGTNNLQEYWQCSLGKGNAVIIVHLHGSGVWHINWSKDGGHCVMAAYDKSRPGVTTIYDSPDLEWCLYLGVRCYLAGCRYVNTDKTKFSETAKNKDVLNIVPKAVKAKVGGKITVTMYERQWVFEHGMNASQEYWAWTDGKKNYIQLIRVLANGPLFMVFCDKGGRSWTVSNATASHDGCDVMISGAEKDLRWLMQKGITSFMTGKTSLPVRKQ